MISILFAIIILAFKAINNRSVIDAIYMIASYTYGPLLGLFVFGLFTKKHPRDKFVPYICIVSPLLCFLTDYLVKQHTGYAFGYEMLMLNGAITFGGLWLSSIGNGQLTIRLIINVIYRMDNRAFNCQLSIVHCQFLCLQKVAPPHQTVP